MNYNPKNIWENQIHMQENDPLPPPIQRIDWPKDAGEIKREKIRPRNDLMEFNRLGGQF